MEENQSGEPVETVAPIESEAPTAPLADDVKDRTKEQFDKLLESNRRLAEENALKSQEIAKREEMDRVFGEQNKKPTQQPAIDPSDLITKDPVTGEEWVNGKVLKTKLEEANAKAARAEQIINSYIAETQDKEAKRQNEEAFAAYPQLDPNGKKFDPNFTKHVRGILQDSMWNSNDYGGRPLSFKAAADFVKSSFQPTGPAALTTEEVAAAKAASDAAQAVKEAASATPVAQPGNASRQNIDDTNELENLKYRTRYLNDDAALAERIKHTEHILAKDAIKS